VCLGNLRRLVFQVVKSSIERKRFLRFLDDCLAYHLHQSGNVEGVLNTLGVLTMEFNALLFDLNLVTLIVLEVTAIDHPKVEIYIYCEHRRY